MVAPPTGLRTKPGVARLAEPGGDDWPAGPSVEDPDAAPSPDNENLAAALRTRPLGSCVGNRIERRFVLHHRQHHRGKPLLSFVQVGP
jgi:hypothetical protein